MKHTKLIILIQGVITIAALAFAAGVYREGYKAEPFALDRLHDTSYMTKMLNLDPQQAQQLALLNTHLQTQLKGSCQRNCSARRDLVAALEQENPTYFENIMKQMCEAYETGERATLEHLQAVRAILDSAQRQKFNQRISRCLCGGCEQGCK
jgi:Spy/CpxP family protein refolding chaperone